MQLRRSSRKCKFRHKVRCSLLKCNRKVSSRLHGSNKRRCSLSNRPKPHLRVWQHSKPNRHKDVPLTEL